jgi:hypothetical protein
MMGLQIAFWCSEFQYYDNRGSGDTTDGGAALQKRRQMDKGVLVLCCVARPTTGARIFGGKTERVNSTKFSCGTILNFSSGKSNSGRRQVKSVCSAISKLNNN